MYSRNSEVLSYLGAILLIAAIVIFVLFLQYKGILHLWDSSEIACEYYSNRLTKDVPARCLSYFSNPH